LPNEPIKRLKYIFNDKNIILEDYESYNHLVERVYNFIGGSTSIRAVYLLGRKGENVQGIKINLMDESVTEYTAPYTQEYNGRPSTGWKLGVLDLNPSYVIV
jgi:hypothetical protein